MGELLEYRSMQAGKAFSLLLETNIPIGYRSISLYEYIYIYDLVSIYRVYSRNIDYEE